MLKSILYGNGKGARIKIIFVGASLIDDKPIYSLNYEISPKKGSQLKLVTRDNVRFESIPNDQRGKAVSDYIKGFVSEEMILDAKKQFWHSMKPGA
jgi:hypothetical protein